jgi:chromosome segregation ATPase
MATQANVTSTEALETFRANLIVFLTKARRAVDDAGDEVKRMRQWLQQDQRMNLEGDLRRKTKQLQQAQQELMTVKLGAHKESALAVRQLAVAKAQREVEEAERKLRKLKGWNQSFDTSADPMVKRMDKLSQSLNELPKAIAYLVNLQNALAAYAESGATLPTTSTSEAPPATEPAPGPEGQA